MSTEATLSPRALNSILLRLKSHFYPADSPRWIEVESQKTVEESALIQQIKQSREDDYSQLTFEKIKEEFQSEGNEDEITEKDIKALGFLIQEFGKVFKDKEGNPMVPFDEQILALIRAVRGYKKGEGLVLEMKTGEGKSSVVIPILIAYLVAHQQTVHIHEINPYLLKESYQRFLSYAQVLGIGDQVGLLKDYKDEQKILEEKRVVFGYWPNFVHHQQYQFLFRKREEIQQKKPKKPPTMILDEVDQILNEEAVLPANLSREQINSESFISSWQEDLLKEKWGKSEAVTIEVPVDDKSYSVEIDPKNLIPQNNEQFIAEIKNFFQILDGIYYDPGSSEYFKDKPKEKIFAMLSYLLPYQVFWEIVIKTIKTRYEIDLDDLGKISQERRDKCYMSLVKIFDNLAVPFWWQDPSFQQSLLTAFVLEEGKDYQIKDGKIQPLSLTTGYPEKSKEFPTQVTLLLYLKHGLSLPKTIIGDEADRLSILSFYLSKKKRGSPIFGFTGTASTVAQRVREVYGLATTAIQEHFSTNREESIEIFSSWQEKKARVGKIIKDTNQNTLIVVETLQQAEEIRKLVEEIGDVEIRILSAANEEDDYKLYKWVSKKGENRRILLCVKMIGRGVDLKPDDKIKKEGFLLISTTPFKYQRSYFQLLGRVGRRGEKGEVYILISPDDEVFSDLSERKKKKLRGLFFDFEKEKNPKKREYLQKQIEKELEKGWRFWEEEITEKFKYWGYFALPIERLRDWIMGTVDLPFLERKLEKYSLNKEEIKDFLKHNWIEFLDYFEDTFNAWLAAGRLGPFGQGEPKAIWTNFVFDKTAEMLIEIFSNYIREVI